MKLLRAADHRRMPWRNGGGETLEVAVLPAGAATGGFDWRVSMAVVASDGPFSLFPGIDRTLVLLDGDGVTLDIVGRRPVMMTRRGACCAFPGDVATTATLAGGPITDLNVMTARGRYAHEVERIAAPTDLRADPFGTLLLIGDGATVESGGKSIDLGWQDVVLVFHGETAHVRQAHGACLLATIRPVG